MLASSTQTLTPKSIEAAAIKATSAPPVVTPTGIHPIYGNTPIGRNGFSLERQHIQMLDYWHRKASAICLDITISEPDFEIANTALGDIYRAAIQVKTNNGREVSIQLGLMLRHFQTSDGPDNIVLSLDDFSQVVASANAAAAPLVPTKRVPQFSKGRKLTQAGLLHRYQAFLLSELEAVSWHLYGSRETGEVKGGNSRVAHNDCVDERSRMANDTIESK